MKSIPPSPSLLPQLTEISKHYHKKTFFIISPSDHCTNLLRDKFKWEVAKAEFYEKKQIDGETGEGEERGYDYRRRGGIMIVF